MRQLASRSIPVLALLVAFLAWPEPAASAETAAEQQSRIEQLRQESATLQRRGEPDQAIQRAAKAVELSSTVYGPSHPEMAASLYGLAELHHMRGQYRDAEPLYRQALGILAISVRRSTPRRTDRPRRPPNMPPPKMSSNIEKMSSTPIFEKSCTPAPSSPR